jgi:hypothetical protein
MRRIGDAFAFGERGGNFDGNRSMVTVEAGKDAEEERKK